MNDRIRELWTKTVVDYGHAGQEACVQQFAEALIEECVTVVSTVKPCFGDYRDQIEVGMRDHCAEMMRLHFGVEE